MSVARRASVRLLLVAVPALAAACSDDSSSSTTPVRPPTFAATLSGANERPPLTVPGNGSATVVVNGTSVTYTVTVAGLTAAPRLAHIHGPADANTNAGVLVNFPTTAVTTSAGTLTGTFTAADIQGQGGQPPISLDSLVALMRAGRTYVNVHTPANGGGEIRGQLAVQP